MQIKFPRVKISERYCDKTESVMNKRKVVC